MNTEPIRDREAPGASEPDGRSPRGPWCPFNLSVAPIARFLNCELDDPVYDGLELQHLDDTIHGTGMLVFLSRRADGRCDYYHEPGLTLDPASFTVGAGMGEWTATTFERAGLDVAENGVAANVRFSDVAGRSIEVVVDDRNGRRRRGANLLAPVSAAIENPHALLLVYLHGFELVRDTSPPPVVRIGSREAATGRLPAARLHGRRLIKYAAPLSAVEVNASGPGPLGVIDPAAPGPVELADDGRSIAALAVRHDEHRTRLDLSPAFPNLAALEERAARHGDWTVTIDGDPITGGTWSAHRREREVDLALEVTRRWRPGRLPLLMRTVTTVVPTFRRWPTTYRWEATVTLADPPRLRGGWQRTGTDRGQAYRRATAS
ncbi:hypothetical protein ER308_18195 [Egibacter rhizosphaerae]|uniref:Uncharacterized protein n=1 Tax=Egibacter rhizosphaerae TaxID=1670831 RepID=A0A411YJA4_9ACTN|nr:hypothetical protein [Egibacter rhizosphaerae]QBI21310.1 hypothetical protein ER308_18195 [Egibacter rhizosphaerae]